MDVGQVLYDFDLSYIHFKKSYDVYVGVVIQMSEKNWEEEVYWAPLKHVTHNWEVLYISWKNCCFSFFYQDFEPKPYTLYAVVKEEKVQDLYSSLLTKVTCSRETF